MEDEVRAAKMRKWEIGTAIVFSIIFGFAGATLGYSNLIPYASDWLRLLVLTVFYFCFAVPIGYFAHDYWKLAGLLSWSAIALGVIGVLGSQDYLWFQYLLLALIFILPVVMSFWGGYVGMRLKDRHLHLHPNHTEEEVL